MVRQRPGRERSEGRDRENFEEIRKAYRRRGAIRIRDDAAAGKGVDEIGPPEIVDMQDRISPIQCRRILIVALQGSKQTSDRDHRDVAAVAAPKRDDVLRAIAPHRERLIGAVREQRCPRPAQLQRPPQHMELDPAVRPAA